MLPFLENSFFDRNPPKVPYEFLPFNHEFAINSVVQNVGLIATILTDTPWV
jgi:hypothetical protein